MSHPHPDLAPPPALTPGGLRIVALGGLGEIGRNMTVFEYRGRLLIVDCGVLFPDPDQPGVDLILPDFGYLDGRLDRVEALVLTHAHCDHCWGIMGDDGSRHFPNAQIYLSQADLDYWTDEAKLSMAEPKYMKPFVEGARKNLLPNRDRIVFVKDGQEVVPGIQAIAAPGHTVGHTMFLVTSEGKSFAFLGDLTHHQILLMEKPRMQFSYDTDPNQAAESRVKMLDMLAANKIAVMSYHYPWPGYGHVVKTGEGFHYLPHPMNMML